MFKHVVVGWDGSPGGRDAVALGAAIASVTSAQLSLVGAFPTSFLPTAGVSERNALRAAATRALQHDRDLLAPGARVHTVADTSVARALRRYAERERAELVVVGSNPSTLPGHAAIGRGGRPLLYDAPFALGLAARGLHDRTSRLQTIGVGYDGAAEAEAALALAAELAGAARAHLQVRRVVEDQVPAFTMEQWMSLKDWDHAHIWEHARASALAETQNDISRLGVQAEAAASVGDPGLELREFSETVDLLFVGSRRWGPVARLVTGGVGETLVTDASCSVLMVPRPSARRRRLGPHGSPAEREVWGSNRSAKATPQT